MRSLTCYASGVFYTKRRAIRRPLHPLRWTYDTCLTRHVQSALKGEEARQGVNAAIYQDILESPLGPICLAGVDAGLTRVDFQHGERPAPALSNRRPPPAYFDQAMQQLREYFEGTRRAFDLPLAPPGTAFQQQVWQALQRIPYGQTTTYQDLAERLGKPRAARAVGTANGRNPIAIIVPCHRVIGRDGRLRGYAGGLPIKQQLLQHEGAWLQA